MLEDKKTFITQEGFNKLSEELEYLKNTRRKEIAERIASAKELGDLSENAEYSDAKDEQLFTENRVAELENIIRNVNVVKKNKKSLTVQVSSTITVLDPHKKERQYTIVGSNEADPINGKISNESPLGQAFLNHKSNDEIDVLTPKGKIKYTILKIS